MLADIFIFLQYFEIQIIKKKVHFNITKDLYSLEMSSNDQDLDPESFERAYEEVLSERSEVDSNPDAYEDDQVKY